MSGARVDRNASVPANSAIHAYLPGASFHDCISARVAATEQSALSHFLDAITRTPRWVNFLMDLRNRIAQRLGLKNLGTFSTAHQRKPDDLYVPGDRVGIFTLISNSDTEVVLCDRDKHLDVVLSVFKDSAPTGRGQSIIITTVVHVHNILGRVYMIPVEPLHELIAPAVLSRIALMSETD